MSKVIFITWWVCSSLGKGIASASMWTILSNCGYSVFSKKLDPYLNIDPWTMSPFQHGEVFVTDDWAETDLDLWHYERFIDTPLSKLSTVTTGVIYTKVLEQERRGDFWGATIQIIPHITNAIKDSIKDTQQKSGTDILMVELGGTVWDIEGEPFLEAARQLRHELWKENVLFVHLTLLPYLKWSWELKTKPTQLSVRDLRKVGIQPDLIFARADYDIEQEHLEKISSFCDVDLDAVIPAKTLDSIYKVPLEFEKYNLSKVLQRKLWLEERIPNLSKWDDLVNKMENVSDTIKIWLAGKYTGLDDAYLSVIEAINSAGYDSNKKIEIVWIDTEKIWKWDQKEFDKVKTVKGIVVPWGFGIRGVEWKIKVAKYCRENNLPYLGLCLGSQILAIEFARSVAWIEWATSEEFDLNAQNKIVHFLPWQSKDSDLWWTLRLWSYPCILKDWTKAQKAYNCSKINERHRHRYEFNNEYKTQLEKSWLIISWTSPDWSLMEIVEIKDHPFMIGSQFHPEFKSRPTRSHPLFREFIKVINNNK